MVSIIYVERQKNRVAKPILKKNKTGTVILHDFKAPIKQKPSTEPGICEERGMEMKMNK